MTYNCDDVTLRSGSVRGVWVQFVHVISHVTFRGGVEQGQLLEPEGKWVFTALILVDAMYFDAET